MDKLQMKDYENGTIGGKAYDTGYAQALMDISTGAKPITLKNQATWPKMVIINKNGSTDTIYGTDRRKTRRDYD